MLLAPVCNHCNQHGRTHTKRTGAIIKPLSPKPVQGHPRPSKHLQPFFSPWLSPPNILAYSLPLHIPWSSPQPCSHPHPVSRAARHVLRLPGPVHTVRFNANRIQFKTIGAFVLYYTVPVCLPTCFDNPPNLPNLPPPPSSSFWLVSRDVSI